jgi:hypothetical protein
MGIFSLEHSRVDLGGHYGVPRAISGHALGRVQRRQRANAR